ncbi:Type-1A pilin [Serratia quinivorans]|jgi:type 1 fimbria pilin|nr:Type-1A pilin [Serratia quinivorans]CAI1565656.1 Type-1A pilin [Serratia quinivorans]CAI1579109.1 Type-1A pilin [Serratia quinivorans]CAI1683818.1 Type-1A pilin [Serratia quinivorans]CAI1737576.1 Type-1A pilin [Serratia quinivorans]
MTRKESTREKPWWDEVGKYSVRRGHCILQACLMGGLLCLSIPAMSSTCRLVTPVTSKIQDINLGNIKLSDSTPIGTVLGTYQLAGPETYILSYSPPDPGFTRLCQAIMRLSVKHKLSPANGWVVANKISSTSVSGLGVRVSLYDSNYIGDEWLAKAGWYFVQVLNYTWKVELIKTGKITSGSLPTGTTLAIFSLTDPNGSWELGRIRVGTAASFSQTTCTLTNTAIDVSLGSISAAKLTAVGSTFGEKTFDVGLNCDPGLKVSVSLSGTQSAETTDSSVLALTGAGQIGVASGLGVQILSDGTLLKRDTNLLVKTVAGGKDSLPFSARYYQTKKDVTGGRANTTATLNITYQ